jgi:hypothetical protein
MIKKRKGAEMANETSSGGTPTIRTQDLRAYLERLEQLEAENARLKLAVSSGQRGGHLPDSQIGIGDHVAARIGTASGSYVQAEIVNIYRPVNTGPIMYELKRLDGGKKSLGLKTSSDLFPPERAAG